VSRGRRSIRRGVALCVAAVLGLGLAGCRGDLAEEPGVVAVVGGTPIRLADVRARHDMGQIGAPAGENPAVERLRAEYGTVLADMIVARLAAQELARRGLAVTGAEIDAAAAKARADYSDEAFSRMLLEERIDPARWRELLADRLALEKFAREVLRPGVRVDVTEAANYYKEHRDAFAMPARVRLRRVRGDTPEAVKAALAAVRKSGESALAGMSGITTTEADLPEANLPAAWREALKGVKPGEATAVLDTDGKGGEFCILLGRQPATVLDPAKAYARVEAALAAQKLDAAFAAWLDAAVAGGEVMVSRKLLADRQEAPQPEKAQGPDELAQARSEAAARDALAREARKALETRRNPPQAVSQEPAAKEPAAPPDETAKGAAAAPQKAASETVPQQEAAPAAQEALPPGETPVPAAAPTPPASPEPAPPAVAAAPEASEPAAATPEAAPVAEVSPPSAAAPGEPFAAAPAISAQPSAATAQTPTVGDTEHPGGVVVFTAIKASWILYAVDGGEEQRIYLKPGKPLRLDYAKKLVVRPGSPSEVSYRQGDRETTVVVAKKESRVLEFP
jgi:cytoskeletal protein RodZ